jgi:hypothetical protein
MSVDNNDNPEVDDWHYFKGIRTMLKRNGFVVCHSSVSWAADVDTRAEDLRKNISNILERENYEKVNIIAHSMGGLDARHTELANARADLAYESKGQFLLSQKLPERMRVMFLAEEIVMDSSLAGEPPEFATIEVTKPIVWK